MVCIVRLGDTWSFGAFFKNVLSLFCYQRVEATAGQDGDLGQLVDWTQWGRSGNGKWTSQGMSIFLQSVECGWTWMNTLTFELVLIRCEQRLGVADATTTIVGEPWGTFDRFRSFLSAPNGWNFKEGHNSVALVGCMDPGHTLTIHEHLIKFERLLYEDKSMKLSWEIPL